MNIFKHNLVNALTNPVTMGDIVISKSGEKYIVKQNIKGEYWLEHAISGFKLTNPISGQIGIVSQIDQLANI